MYTFVDITSPDFVQVAKGYYIEGQKVDDRSKLKGALQTMLNHDGSYLLEIIDIKGRKMTANFL